MKVATPFENRVLAKLTRIREMKRDLRQLAKRLEDNVQEHERLVGERKRLTESFNALRAEVVGEVGEETD